MSNILATPGGKGEVKQQQQPQQILVSQPSSQVTIALSPPKAYSSQTGSSPQRMQTPPATKGYARVSSVSSPQVVSPQTYQSVSAIATLPSQPVVQTSAQLQKSQNQQLLMGSYYQSPNAANQVQKVNFQSQPMSLTKMSSSPSQPQGYNLLQGVQMTPSSSNAIIITSQPHLQTQQQQQMVQFAQSQNQGGQMLSQQQQIHQQAYYGLPK